MRLSIQRKILLCAALAGLAIALTGNAASAVAQSQIGPPTTPGTRTPEQSPINQTTVTPTPPPTMATQSTSPSLPAATPNTGAASSPGLSFGAAPPPIVGGNR